MTLQVTDTLPDSIFCYPVTLRRPLPESWPSADVTQDSIAVPMRIVLVDSTVYLTFDVVPDAGEVQLLRNMTPVTPEIDTIPDDEPDPVSIVQAGGNNENSTIAHSDGKLILYMNDIPDRNLVVSLYDIRGIKVFSQNLFYSGESRNAIDLGPGIIKTGVYFVYLSDNKNTWCKKIFIN